MSYRTTVKSTFHCLKYLQKIKINQKVVSNEGRGKNDLDNLKIYFLLQESVEAAIFPTELVMWSCSQNFLAVQV